MNESIKSKSSFTLSGKLSDYMLLIKMSLSIMVVFSSVISYLLVPEVVFDWYRIT